MKEDLQKSAAAVKRIDVIRKIMDKVEYLPDYADEILWTKEQGYADNYWFRFRSADKDNALYLKGEEIGEHTSELQSRI